MAAHGISTPWGPLYITQEKTNYFFDTVSYTVPQEITDGCNLPDDTLSIDPNGNILYNSTSDIAGFQFDVIGADLIPNSASGGDAGAAGFMIVSDTSRIIGFSLSGSVVSTGCGTLVEVNFENGIPDGLIELVVSDGAGMALSFNNLDMLIGADDWVGAFRPANVCSTAALTDQATCEAASATWLTDEILVGAKQWTIGECGQYVCDLALYGIDTEDPDTATYMSSGHRPVFKIYNTEEEVSYAATPSDGNTPWTGTNGSQYFIDNLFAGSIDVEPSNDFEISYDLDHAYNHLRSFPMDLGSENTLEDVFGNSGDQVNALMGEGLAGMLINGVWSGGLQTITTTDGYWLRAPSTHVEDPLVVSGGFIENPTYNLHIGANLISFPGSETSPVSSHWPAGPGEPLQNEILAILGEGSSAVLNNICTVQNDVCSDPQWTTQAQCYSQAAGGFCTIDGVPDASYTTSYLCNAADGCGDNQSSTEELCCTNNGGSWQGNSCLNGSEDWVNQSYWTNGESWTTTQASCAAAGGDWYQGWSGSLMNLQQGMGYWVCVSSQVSNFQYNLVKEGYCTNPDYTDSSTCLAAGFDWRDRLVNA